MKENLLEWIDRLRKSGEYGHVLMSYVDRNHWMQKLIEFFPEYYIENLTDFNYASGFFMTLNISPIYAGFTSAKYKEYLKQNGTIYSINIEISAIAPYATYGYSIRKYAPPNSTIESSCFPYIKEHEIVGDKVRVFLEKQRLTILSEDLLLIEIPGVKLELREEHVQVYHCLFQDRY